jgi:hypothetical protein
MTGVYTNIAKKRIAQSQETATNAGLYVAEQPVPVSPPAPQQSNKGAEKSNCQLNAWITTNQEQLLNQAYYRLRPNRDKIKKGELIGVAIEVISRILEKQSPATLDASILDAYVKQYERKKCVVYF